MNHADIARDNPPNNNIALIAIIAIVLMVVAAVALVVISRKRR